MTEISVDAVETEVLAEEQPSLVELTRQPVATARVLGRSLADAIALTARLNSKGDMAVEIRPELGAVRLSVSGRWHENTAQTVVSAQVGAEEPAVFTTAVAHLTRLTPILPDDVVDVTIDPNKARLSLEWKGNQINLRGNTDGLSPWHRIEEHENEPDGWAVMTKTQFMDLFMRAAPYAAKEMTRPALTALHLSMLGDALSVEATDGFALAIRKLDDPKDSYGRGFSVLLPSQEMAPLPYALSDDEDEVKVEFFGDEVLFTTEALILRSKYVAGKFPEVAAIVPKKQLAMTVTVHTQDLVKAFKVAKIGGDSPFVDLLIPYSMLQEAGDIEATVFIRSVGGEHNSVYELESLVEYRGEKPLEIGETDVLVVHAGVECYRLRFNPDLVTKGMGNGFHLALEFDNNRTPMLVIDPDEPKDGRLTLVMPAAPNSRA